jgi:hypothetical protein
MAENTASRIKDAHSFCRFNLWGLMKLFLLRCTSSPIKMIGNLEVYLSEQEAAHLSNLCLLTRQHKRQLVASILVLLKLWILIPFKACSFGSLN